MEFAQQKVLYRSRLEFTPFASDQIDARAVACLIDGWLRDSGVPPTDFTAGGAIITGLAAQKRNVATIKALVKERVSDTLFATADDPCLESWLSFMGNCLAVSRIHPDAYYLNLDIGGGTTNLALGRNGEVIGTGCLFAGARHVQVEPGTYRLIALSSYALQLLHALKLDKTIGDSLAPNELGAILDFYVKLIAAAVAGDGDTLATAPFRDHLQISFALPPGVEPVITFSGGVGELLYQHQRGLPLPGTTAFGDLGIDLALRLAQSSFFSGRLSSYTPPSCGHATVLGMCLFGTEISGTTLYLPNPGLLPLADLPILGRLDAHTSAEARQRAVDLVSRSSAGGCLTVALEAADATSVKQFGQDLAQTLREAGSLADRVLVLFVSQNVGKSLGAYASDWGRLPVKLIVIDELDTRNARFASLGAMHENLVPVSLFALQ